jgi:hypothetical protein
MIKFKTELKWDMDLIQLISSPVTGCCVEEMGCQDTNMLVATRPAQRVFRSQERICALSKA